MNSLPVNRLQSGFSLPEILTVLAIIGVIAAIAIPAYSGLTGKAESVEATDFVESLNRASFRFSQANWDLPVAANNAATTDEFLVLRSLQYAWPRSALKPGSPYFGQNYNPTASSDTTRHRIRWNGRTFDLLRPGTTGSGFLKPFTGADFTAANHAFPNGYKPAGMR